MTGPAPQVTTAPGQPAEPWTRALERLGSHDSVELLGLAAGDRLLVAVPHPDDETLALGGILRHLDEAGVELSLVIVTGGEAAYGDGPAGAEALGRTRRGELAAAMAALGVQPTVTWLGWPDGLVADHEAEVTADLERSLTAGREGTRTVVLAPWVHDPHRDHQAVGRAAGAAGRRAGLDPWSYPVWMRHGHAPDDPAVPWARLRRIVLSAEDRAAKQVAIACHRSQLSGPDGRGPVLPAELVEHFSDGHELLVTPAPAADDAGWHFDALYEGNPDPWAAGTSWYEARKRAVLLAALPLERYQLVWEPGCSLGVLTAALAVRADRVVASDVSPRAVAAAARRSAGFGHVEVSVARLPDDPPPIRPGTADLVVLSEVLYYLEAPARVRALDLAAELVSPQGHLVVVHWRGHPVDAHCSGEDANHEVLTRFGDPLAHHLDERFVLDVLRAGPGG